MEALSDKRFVSPGESGGVDLSAFAVSRSLTGVRRRAASQDFYVARVVRWAFYGFIATIPFETLDLGLPLEPTAISLGLLLLALIFQISIVYRKPPPAFGLFALYLIIFAVPTFFFETAFEERAKYQIFIVAQLLAMSWIAYNLMLSEKVAANAMLTLAVSCTLLSILQFSGITSNASDIGSKIERVTALGFHPNNFARILTIGLLAFFGLAYGRRTSLIKPIYAAWFGMTVIGIAILQTGSRGALLALAAGFAVFVLRSGNLAVKFRNALLVLAGIGFFILGAFQIETMRGRFENAVENGDLARREQIYPTAWEMFKEKPFFGWGNTTGEYELGARLAHPEEESKNPHNLILHLFIITGVIGAFPMLAGIGLALLAAWKARHGPRGVLPLSLIVAVATANMSGLWLHSKLHWIVMAYALSSFAAVAGKTRVYRLRRFYFTNNSKPIIL